MKFYITLLIIMVMIFSCEEIIEPEKGEANIFLSGELYPSQANNLKGYQGSVINKGLETGFNCVVNISCIDTFNVDTVQRTFEDSVLGSLVAYPADGGNIKPAERIGFYTYFDSTASSVFNFNLVDSFYVKIEFETK